MTKGWVDVINNSKALENIYDELVNLYGPVMELGDLATVLRRNRNGIREAVSKAERERAEHATENDGKIVEKANNWASRLADGKTRVGKKIMFRTRVVADLLESGEL